MSQTAFDIATDPQPGVEDAEPAMRDINREISRQESLRRALAHPRYEVIPMRGVLARARKLPAGVTVTVTCSPSRGLAATVALAEQIQQLGYTAVPHLAAKRFRSRSELDETMARLTEAGIQDVFVVGGDGAGESGPFTCGADLISALAETQPNLRSVGIPCYPEGHGFIAAEMLDEALSDKCFFAGHMVTQICFDSGVIDNWLAHVRARGIDLPVYIGIPGVIERRKLLGIALRIGLGDSTRFLKKNGGFMGRLAGPSQFTPDELIDSVAGMLANSDLGIAGFHINTFNQVESTETWRLERLSALAESANNDIPAASAAQAT